MPIPITINGITYNDQAPEVAKHIETLTAQIAQAKADSVTAVAAVQTKLDAATAAGTAVQTKLDAANAEIAGLPAKIAAAAKAKVKLGCVFQSRFAEGARLVRSAVEKGRFGRIVLGDAYIKWYRSQEYYDSSQWRGTWKLDGGGALINQGIHQVDLLLWFMGPAKWVRAESRILAHERIEVEDLACATIGFENGALGVIEASTAIWPGHPARVEIHGSEGSAVVEDGELHFWRFKKETKADERVRASFRSDAALGSGAGDPLSDLKCEGHRRQIQDFVHAIRDDRPPFVDGPEGRRAVALIEAIYKSAASGKTVRL